jgi:hypothetical protein
VTEFWVGEGEKPTYIHIYLFSVYGEATVDEYCLTVGKMDQRSWSRGISTLWQTMECLHLCTGAVHMVGWWTYMWWPLHNNSWIMIHAVYHWRQWNHSYWIAWLVWCHEHWHNAHKRQGKAWPLSFCTNVISGDAFMSESVAGDDIWDHHFDPESKWKLM